MPVKRTGNSSNINRAPYEFDFKSKPQKINKNLMLVGRRSQISGKWHELDLDVTKEQLERFENRIQNCEYVQTIFSHLPAQEREFIKSGITPKEWTEMFGDGN